MQFKRGCFDSLMTRRRNNNQSRRKRIAARIQANLGRIVQNHDPKSTQLSLKNSFSALGHWNALATGEYEPKKPFQGSQTNRRRNQRFHGNYITRAMNHCTNQHHKSPGKEGERSEDAIHSCRMVRCLRSNLEPSSHRSEEDQGNNVQPDARTHDDLPHEATVNKYHKTPSYQKKEGEDMVYTCRMIRHSMGQPNHAQSSGDQSLDANPKNQGKHPQHESRVRDNKTVHQIKQKEKERVKLTQIEDRMVELLEAMKLLQGEIRDMKQEVLAEATTSPSAQIANPVPVLNILEQTPPVTKVPEIVVAVKSSNVEVISNSTKPKVAQANTLGMSRAALQKFIEDQVKQANAGAMLPIANQPYPDDYNNTSYPKGYVVPSFKTFNGIGNPEQHLNHFKITCGDSARDDRLLLRQFDRGLTSVAFNWYAELEPGSILTFNQLAEKFKKRFGMGISDKVTLMQLSEMKPANGEEITDFIHRWRTASIRCERPLQEDQAVQLLIGRINGWMKTFLYSNRYTTFSALMEYITNLQNSQAQIIGDFRSLFYKNQNESSNDESDEESNKESDEASDDESDEESNEESDEELDDESGKEPEN